MFRRLSFTFKILSLIFAISWTIPAQAVPSFAKNYNVPCSMCHSAFPKLNQFGAKFRINGYRMPTQPGKHIWEQPVPLGMVAHGGFVKETSDTHGHEDEADTHSEAEDEHADEEMAENTDTHADEEPHSEASGSENLRFEAESLLLY
jgi:hypothetical protein